jgi:hypothetical protein
LESSIVTEEPIDINFPLVATTTTGLDKRPQPYQFDFSHRFANCRFGSICHNAAHVQQVNNLSLLSIVFVLFASGIFPVSVVMLRTGRGGLTRRLKLTLPVAAGCLAVVLWIGAPRFLQSFGNGTAMEYVLDLCTWGYVIYAGVSGAVGFAELASGPEPTNNSRLARRRPILLLLGVAWIVLAWLVPVC